MKTIQNFLTSINSKQALCLLSFLFIGTMLMAQSGGGTHPGFDPMEGPGMSIPVDGGILMGALAVGSLVALLFKKKKKDS